MGRGGCLVARVNDDGGGSSATTAAASSAPSVMENDDMAVFGVALVVPGVTEPFLDFSLCQVGELHQTGDLGITDKVVFKVAGFQLC